MKDSRPDAALEILRQRYARGEISKEERLLHLGHRRYGGHGRGKNSEAHKDSRTGLVFTPLYNYFSRRWVH